MGKSLTDDKSSARDSYSIDELIYELEVHQTELEAQNEECAWPIVNQKL